MSPGSCPFCDRIAAGEYDNEVGGLGVYSFEPLNPVTPGHRLFVPREHVITAARTPALTGLVFIAASLWAREQWPTDFNLIVSSGVHASQTVPHLHVHYVPRREGDGLVLPWTGQEARR